MAQITVTKKYLSKVFGIVSSAPGFESLSDQKAVISEFADKSGFLIFEFVDSYPKKTIATDEFFEGIKKSGVVGLICGRLSLLPLDINNLESLIGFFAQISEANIAFMSIAEGIDTDEDGSALVKQLNLAWPIFKNERKAANARASTFKAKSRNNRTGRKKIRNDAEIRELRNTGLTIREISEKVGLSTTAIKRSLKGLSETQSEPFRLRP